MRTRSARAGRGVRGRLVRRLGGEGNAHCAFSGRAQLFAVAFPSKEGKCRKACGYEMSSLVVRARDVVGGCKCRIDCGGGFLVVQRSEARRFYRHCPSSKIADIAARRV